MTDILFTNSYFYRFDQKQWETKQPYPPLGTLFAAALMREEKYNISFHDNNLEKSTEAIQNKITKERPKYLVIYDDGFNYLTKMCLTVMREAALKMAAFGKKNNCTVIISSSDSTDQYQHYLLHGVDYVIHGEGEFTLKELINSLQNKLSVEHILGISYQQNGHIQKTAKRPVHKNLDELPMPAWDLVDVEPYRKIWMQGHGFFSLNIATTRGCPYKCNWCAKPIYGNRYNSRSPKKVIEEIEYLVTNFNTSYFWMCDDIFGLKPGWVQSFNELKNDKNLSFKYKIQSRVDLMLKENNLDALIESGLDTAWLGAESGSQKILDAMDKEITVEQIYSVSKLLKKKQVKIGLFLQFGYLNETIEDIKKTIKMVLDIMPDEIGISVSYPLPGTKFYEKVKSDLVLKSNWTDSNDLDMMFKNTFPKEFYKTLHKYVHDRYRIKKGLQTIQHSVPGVSIQSKIRDIAAMIYHLPLAVTNNYKLNKYAKQSNEKQL